MYSGLIIAGLSSGLYLPSGIAILTDLIKREHWGKALAIHELAPNLGFVTAPFLAEAFLRLFSWRGTLGLLGGWSILMGVIFLLLGRGGDQKGEPPHLRSMQNIVGRPFFWVMSGLFAVSIGATLGVYTMMPLFLVSELGMDRELGEHLDRVFQGFWSRDPRSVGLDHRPGWTQACDALVRDHDRGLDLSAWVCSWSCDDTDPGIPQAISAVCLFPVGFRCNLLFPAFLRNLVVSLVVLIGFLIGGGTIPLGIGCLAEMSSFSLSFSLLGVFMLGMLHIASKRIRRAQSSEVLFLSGNLFRGLVLNSSLRIGDFFPSILFSITFSGIEVGILRFPRLIQLEKSIAEPFKGEISILCL